MSYSDSFPTQRPSLNLVFNGGSDQLDSRISFSRADTPPTYAAPSAVHYWSNEKHLSSLNLTSNSEDFSAWYENGVTATATANTTAAPDGNTTASTLTGNAGTALKRLQSNSFAVTDPVISVYAKAGTHSYIQISDSQSTQEYANFDIANGTVGNVGTLATAAIQAVGSTGWYRCIMRVTGTSAAFKWRVVMIDSSTAARESATSSTGTVHLWGAMATDIGDLTNVVAYQPSGSQIHREYSSTLKSVTTSGQPRFEYDPTDGQSVGTAKGLLIEAQATNLVTRSEEFDSWSVANGSIQSNVAVAPDGTLSADTLTEAAEASPTTNSHYVLRNITPAVSTSYTFSVYLKSAGRNNALLYTSVGGVSVNSIFNLSNGTVTYTGGSVTNAISPAGNGWYRCSITWTTTSTAVGSVRVYTADSDTTSTYTGNGYGAIICWGAQVETGAASSYIKTTSSTVSRAADSCSVALSETNYSGGEGSLVVDLSINGRTSGIGAVISDGSTENYYQVGQFASSLTYILYSELNNSVQANITQAATSIGSKKLAASWDTNDISACLDGGAVTTDTSNAFPLLTDLDIGSNPTGAAVLNGHIKRLSLFNVALSDTELQALTS